MEFAKSLVMVPTLFEPAKIMDETFGDVDTIKPLLTSWPSTTVCRAAFDWSWVVYPAGSSHWVPPVLAWRRRCFRPDGLFCTLMRNWLILDVLEALDVVFVTLVDTLVPLIDALMAPGDESEESVDGVAVDVAPDDCASTTGPSEGFDEDREEAWESLIKDWSRLVEDRAEVVETADLIVDEDAGVVPDAFPEA